MGFRCSRVGGGERQISSCRMKGPLSSLLGHIRGVRCFARWGEKRFPPNSASIYFRLPRPAASALALTFARRTCCTHAGSALIPDCFGFCGGLIRLLFKLRAKPVCARLSECVCVMIFPQPVVGIAQFQLLLLALCSTGPILSPVSSLTPAFHYYLAPVQERLHYRRQLQAGEAHFLSTQPIMGSTTASVCQGLGEE